MNKIESDEITEQFLIILRKHLKFVKEEPIQLEANLSDLGLDSRGAVNLLLDIEETFEIMFPESMLTTKIFRTGVTLQEAVYTLIETQGEIDS